MSVKIRLRDPKMKDPQYGRNTDNESKRSRPIENNRTCCAKIKGNPSVTEEDIC